MAFMVPYMKNDYKLYSGGSGGGGRRSGSSRSHSLSGSVRSLPGSATSTKSGHRSGGGGARKRKENVQPHPMQAFAAGKAGGAGGGKLLQPKRESIGAATTVGAAPMATRNMNCGGSGRRLASSPIDIQPGTGQRAVRTGRAVRSHSMGVVPGGTTGGALHHSLRHVGMRMIPSLASTPEESEEDFDESDEGVCSGPSRRVRADTEEEEALDSQITLRGCGLSQGSSESQATISPNSAPGHDTTSPSSVALHGTAASPSSVPRHGTAASPSPAASSCDRYSPSSGAESEPSGGRARSSSMSSLHRLKKFFFSSSGSSSSGSASSSKRRLRS